MKLDELQDSFDRKIEDFGVRIKDKSIFKVRNDVFDESTYLALYKLAKKGMITAIGSSISIGKEANVLYGEQTDRAIAIKIYRIQTADFKNMSEYIIGDRRFSQIKRKRRDLIFAWTKKEYSNLSRAFASGIRVPEPLKWDRNILIMEFIGEDEVSYPQMRNSFLSDPSMTYNQIIQFIEDLYLKAGLIHADLSEYNILIGGGPVFIDMGQSLQIDHPRALFYLKRDITNINRYFMKSCEVVDPEKFIDSLLATFEDRKSGMEVN